MKIIDLLNKIANEEEVPKYVQYYNMLKDKTDNMMVCKENIFYKLDQLEIQLNSRVEPLEEEKKIPEKLKWVDYNIEFTHGELNKEFRNICNTVDEIINYLENKGE